MNLYGSLAPIYDELFPLPAAAPAFLESLLGDRAQPGRAPSPGRALSLLDAGCATGSLVLEMAGRGWDAVGIEPEEALIDLARAGALRRGLTRARFVRGDMLEARSLAGPGAYDLVLCLGNTLPHLSRDGALRFMAVARDLLAPGGCLVLQLINYSRPDLGPGFAFPELEARGQRFLRHYEAGPEGRLLFVTELSGPAGGPTRGEVALEPFEPAYLARALGEAGFAPPRLFSGWAGVGFEGERDLYLLVLASPLLEA